MKSTATANSNIALVKYWGKRDEKLILPHNSSISMTLDGLYTTTTVEFSEKYKADTLSIDGEKISGEELERAALQLNIVRKRAGVSEKARIVSESNFPKAAGLASSASGFAALTLASAKALDLDLSARELSIIARQGSGSACRSFHDGFVEWTKGSMEDGSDSYAKQIAPKDHWPELAMVVSVVTSKEKKIKSRAGMRQTVANSPFYKAWLEGVEDDLEKVRAGILEKKFTQLGVTAELNALKMHSTMITTTPHIIYWTPETVTMMKEVMAMREEGMEAYFTIDGGPQVKILCLDRNAKKIQKRITEMKEVKKVYVCHAGDAARTEKKGLF
ncbi:MAG TPA: diphosphomevalonate decarboxylase [archaeon]|nr:diphosphomevalonate decarboxylase [archaeon]